MAMDNHSTREDGERATPRAPSRQDRRLHDDHMHEWHVYERRCGADDYSAVRLVFESGSAIRTLADYPPHWDQLSDRELLALSERPVRQRSSTSPPR